jgi:hypothetical protein
MQYQLIFLLLFVSFDALGVDEKSIQELFRKYELVMDHKKIDLIDEVFTKKFIKTSGGKEELIAKIKELRVSPQKIKSQITWKRGKGNLALVRMKEIFPDKSKNQNGGNEFIVIIEDSKPKIDGTLSDAD